MGLDNIEWRITNMPEMKTFYVTFTTDDDTLEAINEWLKAQQIDLFTRSLCLSGPTTIGKLTFNSPAMGSLRFVNEEGAALFRLTWC